MKEGWKGEGLKICHAFADFFVFKDQLSNFEGEGFGGYKFAHFCGRYKCLTPKWFKLQPFSY